MNPTQSNNTTQLKRAQLKHVLLDADFFNNPKIQALHVKFPRDGQISIIQIYCAMSRATDGVIDHDAIVYILSTIRGFKYPEEFIKYCLEKGIIQKEANGYSNSRVIKDQISLQNKRDKDKERQQKYRDKLVSHSLRNDSKTVFPVTDPVSDTDPVLDNNKIKVLDFLYFDEISLDTWKMKLGEKFDRTCEKLNGWIGESKGTPEHQARLAKGRNASFTIQNWVARAVSSEATPAETLKSKNKKFLEEHRSKLLLKEMENAK